MSLSDRTNGSQKSKQRKLANPTLIYKRSAFAGMLDDLQGKILDCTRYRERQSL